MRPMFNMNTDTDRFDWMCENPVTINAARHRGEWRVYDYAIRSYIGFGQTSREAIDNAMMAMEVSAVMGREIDHD